MIPRSPPVQGDATLHRDRPGPHRALLEDLLARAGREALQWFRDTEAHRKADGTEVTDADRAAEEIIVETLAREFPRASIVGEEGAQVTGPDGTWYVDPIDGTSAYLEGLAYWGPTICLERDGTLAVGAFHLPRLDEFWYAARDVGAWRNATRLRPDDPEGIGRNDSLYVPSRFHRRAPLAWPGKVRALGSTAAHLAHVAAGGAAATVVGSWAIWDVGCGTLLVREAGRQMVDLTGAPFEPIGERGTAFVAGSASAVALLLEHVAERKAPDT